MNAHVRDWNVQYDTQRLATGTGRTEYMSVGWRCELKIELTSMTEEIVHRFVRVSDAVAAIERAIESVFKPENLEDAAPIGEVLPAAGRKIVL